MSGCLSILLAGWLAVCLSIGPLQDPVTWYGINYTGTQMTQWDFQNKRKSRWTGKSSFVLEIPLRHLRPSVIYSVPCDWILQRAYYSVLFPSIRPPVCLSYVIGSITLRCDSGKYKPLAILYLNVLISRCSTVKIGLKCQIFLRSLHIFRVQTT